MNTRSQTFSQRAFAAGRPDVPAASLDYVFEINDPDHVAVVNGFTRVRYAGTGFLMIRRHVFEKMCAHPDYAPLRFSRAEVPTMPPRW